MKKEKTYYVCKSIKRTCGIFFIKEDVVLKDGFKTEKDALDWMNDRSDKFDLWYEYRIN